MDCLVLPIQARVEEWKKVTNILDKEHHKGIEYISHFLKLKSISYLLQSITLSQQLIYPQYIYCRV